MSDDATYDWLSRLSYQQMLEREQAVVDNLRRLFRKLDREHTPRKVIDIEEYRWRRQARHS